MIICLVLFVCFGLGVFVVPVRADDCGNDVSCLGRKIEEFSKELSVRSEANEKNAAQMRALQARVAGLQGQVNEAEEELVELGEELDIREERARKQFGVLFAKTRNFYKSLRRRSILAIIFDEAAGTKSRDLAYQSTSRDQDRQIILRISGEMVDIGSEKESLETQKKYLANLSAQLNKQAEFLEGEVAGVNTYLSSLESKIAALSAKQQQLIAEKLGSLNLPTSLGGGALMCTDDRNIDPGFSNAFAFYTYGIPHRVGMSQYGAYGRAKAGQNYDQILRAYYNFDGYEDKGNTTIRVNNGKGIKQGSVIWSGSLEDYVKRIYEIPASWPMASLQAQAIAARSYALAVTSNGANSICANQWCQVFKTDPKGGDWEGAVNGTAGKVMVAGGQIITAWYASTAGGYTFANSDIWGGSQRQWTKRLRDTNGDVGSWSDLQSKAYDKDSPCFYAAQGWRNEYGKSAWLKSSEVADIVNVLMLAKKDGSTQKHLSQIDKPNPDGVETWNAERVKSELRSRGGNPYDNISDVVIGADFGVGKTISISINGQSFPVNEFVDFFNLRAPANIQIVGPLFNIESK